MTDEQEPQLTEDEEQSIQDLIAEYLEFPAFILALTMLVILIVELTVDLAPPWRRILLTAGTVIWWLFIFEYILRVFLAENRLKYIRTHLLDALFIIVPFFRVLRFMRAFRSVRLMRIMSPTVIGRTYVTTRRGLRRLGRFLGKRSFVYVIATTLVVLFIGSLMIFLLERGAAGSVITTYGSALWWTIGILTTVGSQLDPVTAEGRFVGVFIMIYGVGVFGYIAATLASYFITSDVEDKDKADTGLSELAAKVDEILRKLEERDEAGGSR